MSNYKIKQPFGNGHPAYQLNNDGIDPIMTTMPGWMVRWGTVVLCGLFAAFLAIAGCIHFPDVINVPVHITGAPGREGFVAEGSMPAALAKQISGNETVVISRTTYQQEVFGTISGTIDRIVPSGTGSETVLHISGVIKTNENSILLQEGNAQVTINDRSLLGRFFDKIIR